MRAYFKVTWAAPLLGLFWRKSFEWDRVDVWVCFFPCLSLRVDVDRAWVDDRQYNPLNWLSVLIWRRRHPVWVSRIGFRLDRLVFDRKLGLFWASRTLGERAKCLVGFAAHRRAWRDK